MPTVYLAGPINGCTDEEANGWRTAATAALVGWTVLDPMARDYRGREADNAAAIVEGDKADIFRATYLLANATRPSWGTAMEIQHAHKINRVVVAFGTLTPSPWLAYHCESVHPTLGDALLHLCEIATTPKARRGAAMQKAIDEVKWVMENTPRAGDIR
jgi:nucleoside 2-deoxyribosyltransferase